ncbi:hypothetical protein Tco_1023667 [Tanacetum coccineum]
MPLDIPKPPDPIVDDFCALTRMSPEGLTHAPYVPSEGNKLSKQRGRPKGVKNRAKNVKIKVQSPGSASVRADALLKRLKKSKMTGKGSNQMMFKEGVSDGDGNRCHKSVCKLSCLSDGNDDPCLVSNSASMLDMADNEHVRVKSARNTNKDGELCNGNGIGKIFSGIGKPMLMDKLIKERCLKKSGKLNFVRVLVEVNAFDDLLNFLEIKYPQVGKRPARVVRPRTEEEIATKVIKDALKSSDNVSIKRNDDRVDNEGFVIVGRRNKPVVNNKQFVVNNRNGSGDIKQNFVVHGRNSNIKNDNVKKDQVSGVSRKSELVHKSPLISRYNENFKPRVLVRGSGSGSASNGVTTMAKDIPVTNAFQALSDQDMADNEEECIDGEDEEYVNIICPKLKLEFGMEPFVDNEDVGYDKEGMADMMKPEVVCSAGPETEEIKAINEDVISVFVVSWKQELRRINLVRFVQKFLEIGIGCQMPLCVKGVLKDLVWHSLAVKNVPWALLCDFNIIMDPSKRSMGSSFVTISMEEFREYMFKIEAMDVVRSRLHFTWNKSPGNPGGLLKSWTGLWDLAANVKRLKEELCRVQTTMANDPFNADIRKEEASLSKRFNVAVKDKELFLKQRSKVSWLSEGDHNTKFFHKC